MGKGFHLNKEDIHIQQDQYMGYCPLSVMIDDSRELNALADEIGKKNGRLPLFTYDEECDLEDWYNFFFEVDNGKVVSLSFEYGLGNERGGEIEIDEETKANAMEVIYDYYGGKEEYEKACEEYWL